MDNSKDLRLVVLIDADNIPYANIKGMLEEVAKYGTPTFKRIYGDWTKPNLAGWKNVLLDNAITPIQQYSYTVGKNATDSAMIIDAMDILYTGRVDGFCLVSSDSDFTRLATRLREAGMKVFGMGEKKTPSAFRAACDKFIYIEILGVEEEEKEDSSPSKPQKAKPKKESISKVDKGLLNLLKTSINDIANEDGWAFVGELGNMLLKKQPDFDPRNYGFKKLVPLVKSYDIFEIDERDSGKNRTKHVYVRVKA
jgi:Fe-S-cluster formation regulator IscX/YfhJ